jgi:hypothetical protein
VRPLTGARFTDGVCIRGLADTYDTLYVRDHKGLCLWDTGTTIVIEYLDMTTEVPHGNVRWFQHAGAKEQDGPKDGREGPPRGKPTKRG